MTRPQSRRDTAAVRLLRDDARKRRHWNRAARRRNRNRREGGGVLTVLRREAREDSHWAGGVGRVERLRDVGRAHAGERRFAFVDVEPQAGGQRFETRRDVDDAAFALEHGGYARGDRAPSVEVGSGDFRQNGGAHGRSGRCLQNAQRRTVAPRDGVQAPPQLADECRRLNLALTFGDAIDADVGEIRDVAEHRALQQTGKVRDRVRAREDFVVGDLRHAGKLGPDRVGDRRRAAQRARRRRVDTDKNVVSLTSGSMRNCSSCTAGSAALTANASSSRLRKMLPNAADPRAPQAYCGTAESSGPRRGCPWSSHCAAARTSPRA
jgi:hypothetical protein